MMNEKGTFETLSCDKCPQTFQIQVFSSTRTNVKIKAMECGWYCSFYDEGYSLCPSCLKVFQGQFQEIEPTVSQSFIKTAGLQISLETEEALARGLAFLQNYPEMCYISQPQKLGKSVRVPVFHFVPNSKFTNEKVVDIVFWGKEEVQ